MTQATQTRKSTKVVQIIARFEFKADPRKVCYSVRSSDGRTEYTTCLFNGKACSCSCPSKKPCYHMTGVEAYEAERTSKEREVALDAAKEEAIEKAADLREYKKMVNEAEEKIRRQASPLAGASRGFSLMR